MRRHLRSILVAAMVVAMGTPSSSDNPDCDEEFVCPGPGSYADPCTCRRFYKCHDGSPHRSFCPSPLYWDDVKKFCTYKNEAVCGPVEAASQEDEQKRKEEKEKAERERAPRCDSDACQLPFCYCSRKGIDPPTGKDSDPKQLPQFVLLTLDGAVNNNNYFLYRDLFNVSEKLRATFFLEHQYCDYYNVERLYVEGHEMAILSVRGRSMQEASTEEWAREIRSMRRIMKQYANVNPDDVLGMRAPQARPGYNAQFEALVEEGLVWDASASADSPEKPVWPYTLDFRVPHVCKIRSCPTSAYPGVWEVPLNAHFVGDQTGGVCYHLDQCVFTHQTSDHVFEWLKEDFNRHYEDNRAPYVLSLHTNWFLSEHQRVGLKRFLEWTTSLDDVRHTTITSYLLWITDPENLTSRTPSDPYRPSVDQIRCNKPTTCETSHDREDEGEGPAHFRYYRTCSECPQKYPWLDEKDEEADEGEK